MRPWLAGPHWERLLAAKGKVPHVKTDFNKWVDEDEEDEMDKGTFTFYSFPPAQPTTHRPMFGGRAQALHTVPRPAADRKRYRSQDFIFSQRT